MGFKETNLIYQEPQITAASSGASALTGALGGNQII